MTNHLLQHTPWRMVSAAASWHVSSQQRARRNALVASTALMARRQERLDVEEFLEAHASRTREIHTGVRPAAVRATRHTA